MPDGLYIEGLDDSKKLTDKKRERLYNVIRESCIDCAVAHAEVYEIEKHNILNASMLAMNRAVAKLRIKPELVLADGNIVRGFQTRAVPVIKGDALCPSIAAASVLAKVTYSLTCSGPSGSPPCGSPKFSGRPPPRPSSGEHGRWTRVTVPSW